MEATQSSYNLIVAQDDIDFGHKARDAFLAALKSSRKHQPSVILPTGNTPKPFYQALRDLAYVREIGFSYRQLDEYLGLPEGHPKTFLSEMRREVLGPLNIKPSLAFNTAADVGFEVDKAYSVFSLSGDADIAVIGIGSNGHVGFNEPGSDFDSTVRRVALSEQTIRDNQKNWNESIPFPKDAITLGIRELRRASQTILLARGENKAEIMARFLLAERPTTDIPATYLMDQPNVVIVADRAAMANVPRGFALRFHR